MIVVFDIGNVLLRWDRRYLYRKVFDNEERMERFLATALDMDFVAQTDIAKDLAAAVAMRTKSFPEFAKELHMFHERWIETLGDPIEENVACCAGCARQAIRSTRSATSLRKPSLLPSGSTIS